MRVLRNVLLASLGCVVLVTCILVSRHVIQQERAVKDREEQQRIEKLGKAYLEQYGQEKTWEELIEKSRQMVKNGFLTEAAFHKYHPGEELHPKGSKEDRVKSKMVKSARQGVKEGHLTEDDFHQLLPGEELYPKDGSKR